MEPSEYDLRKKAEGFPKKTPPLQWKLVLYSDSKGPF